MDYVVKDEDLVISVDFMVNGNFVYPDNNVYSYLLRSIDGTVIYSSDSQDIMPIEEPTVPENPKEDEDNTENPENPDKDTEKDTETGELIPTDRVNIVISSEYNKLDDDLLYKTQIVEVKFLYKGRPYTIKKPYRITSYFYFNASAEDVRNYYGLNGGELPDEDIDLNEVYLQLVQKLGDTFVNCLNSDIGVGNIRANRLIVLKGVVQVFPSVKLRVNQEELDGSSKFIRYLNKINWDDFLDNVLAEIEELENNLTGEESVSYNDYTPLFLGSVVDAITGES